MLTLPPLSLYIHIPWCVRKCPYCDFNSHVTPELPESNYLENLKRDLLQDQLWTQGRKLQSIFFGGGTPSLFSAKTIADILNFAEQKIGFDNDIEITLEANPGTFEQQKFSDFFTAGVNRLSIGIQSFEQKHLQKLGRIHNQEEALKAVDIARKAGFTNLNLDLMHGLPDQTIEEAISDLTTAIQFEPEHISWYQLTIEPNTVFYREQPPLPEDECLADIQEAGLDLLAQNDFHQYEVSAFSKNGRQSKHNLNYWQFGDYIGIGAGAHGKFTDTAQQKIIRRQKTRLPEHYMANLISPKFKEFSVDNEELPLEFLMNALRLNEGVPLDYFSDRTGRPLSTLEPQRQTLTERGLLSKNPNRLQTTPQGHAFLNQVLAEFML